MDGAVVSVWIPGESARVQTTSGGRYSFSGLRDGDYLLKVEKTGMALLYGAVRLTSEDHHEFNVALAKNPGAEPTVRAESPYDLDAQQSRLSKASAGKVKQARLLKQVAPIYPTTKTPPAAHSIVQVAGFIRANGRFDNLIVLAAPNPEFALAALSAMRQWRYSPTYVDGQAVDVVTITDVLFHPR